MPPMMYRQYSSQTVGCRLQHQTPAREVAFLQSPAPKGWPIEHIDIGAPNDGNILRLLTVKHPDGHLASRFPDSGKAHQITTDGSVSEVRIVHDKDRRMGGPGDKGNGLACVNEGVPAASCMIDVW